MRKIDDLLNMSEEQGMGPARSQLRHDGTQCHTWYAGEGVRRFVRVEDLPGDDDALLVTVVDDKPVAGHDGLVERVYTCRRTSPEAALRAVEYVLGCMGRGVRIDVSVL